MTISRVDPELEEQIPLWPVGMYALEYSAKLHLDIVHKANSQVTYDNLVSTAYILRDTYSLKKAKQTEALNPDRRSRAYDATIPKQAVSSPQQTRRNRRVGKEPDRTYS